MENQPVKTEMMNKKDMESIINSINKPKKEINYQFKVLYCIGIINVLIAHSHADALAFWNEIVHLASFTIAMFVFSSGYFYNKKNDSKPIQYIWKKFTKLIIPLYLWHFFYAILIIISSGIGFTIALPLTWEKILLYPINSIKLLGYNNPAWFIVPLFVTEIYNVLMRRLLIKIEGKKTDYIMLSFNFILGFIGVYLAMHEYNRGWWLFLLRLCYFAPFYSLGYVYKNYLQKKDVLPSFWYFFIIILYEILIILIYGHTSSYSIVGMDSEFFENPVIPFLSGIAGLAFWLRISRILSPVIGKSKYVNAIANNTFPIMMNHIFGFMIMKVVFFVFTKIFAELPEFNVDLFKSDMLYLYLPRGRGFNLLYIVFGILIPIYLQKLVDLIKNIIYKLGRK